MPHPLIRLSQLQRPRLLVRAAREVARHFNRERQLRRVLGCDRMPDCATSVGWLIEMEEELEAARVAAEGSYSCERHVAVLGALMAESAMLSAPLSLSDSAHLSGFARGQGDNIGHFPGERAVLSYA